MMTFEQAKKMQQEYTKQAAGCLAKAAAARADGDVEYAEYMEECAAEHREKAAYFAKKQ